MQQEKSAPKLFICHQITFLMERMAHIRKTIHLRRLVIMGSQS